ncbi:hypothetical protein CROQUDRAFT_110707 [Cronartium quercuum f. sp. fusiforme G11]|uniref:Uncharacterized protein n=1 Tax=Cronartium quercuum f. sp. fusiforme G11 TaxID=708437 RepID=A0A9P6N845_9BASI|nr:hypothetical protein CROQUDRAFT_110707 [Cronartium quercuum f. sp. fusiforme G11]
MRLARAEILTDPVNCLLMTIFLSWIWLLILACTSTHTWSPSRRLSKFPAGVSADKSTGASSQACGDTGMTI